MLKIAALDYLRLGARIEDAQGIFGFLAPEEGRTDWSQRARRDLSEILKEVYETCRKLDMPASRKMFAEAILDPPQTEREWLLMTRALYGELESKVFAFIPSHRIHYFDPIIPTGVRTAFPKATAEIEGSGRALALGLFTASVFHAMRAAEIGLRTLGTKLEAQFPFDIELADWQNIQEQIDSKIKARAVSLPRGLSKDQELKFLSEAAAQLRYFKDGWRIRVAHARATYDEGQATQAFEHVADFLGFMSEHLIE